MSTYKAVLLLSGSQALTEGLGNLPVNAAGGVRLEGTNLIVEIEAESAAEAETASTLAAERFCDALSLRTGEHFAPQFMELIERVGTHERIAKAGLTFIWREVAYRLADLPADTRDALTAMALEDDVLRKASAYFRHALFLHQEAWRHVVPGSFDWALFMADALLHYFKATSVILGEAGTDRDYQSRYQAYGMSRELWLESERLREIRSDADVAHYARDWAAVEQAKKNIMFAKRIAAKVLDAYVAFLQKKGDEAKVDGTAQNSQRGLV